MAEENIDKNKWAKEDPEIQKTYEEATKNPAFKEKFPTPEAYVDAITK